MPTFQDSFWTGDYAAGLGVLFTKLQQGVVENRQVLTVARMRAEAEEVYGQRLSEIAPAVDKVQGGFGKDDGASVRKAYEGIRTEMDEGAKKHKKIAQNIRDLVVNPFSRWCEAHETRLQDSQDELQNRIKTHDRQAELVKKLRSHYFNKCRLVEDLEEETKFAFQDPQDSPKPKIPEIKVSANKETEASDEDIVFEIGDETFDPPEMKKRLAHMLNNIKLQDTKVPILGTYLNTSAGADIVEYLQKYMDTTSVSYAERIGQDLISNGFLRLVGNVGNTFANSSKMFYQWRPKAFKMSGVPEKKPVVGRTFSMASNGSDAVDSPVVGTVSEYLAGWNPLNNSHPGETPADRLRREQKEADDKYKDGVKKLDESRCELEEAISSHLKFLERCELDRLKAIKTVILDFSGCISNVIPSLQSAVDNMMLFQETIQPQGDLRYLLENYRTGRFAPKVVVYENYYNKVDDQTFGVDLEARARADKKRVPIIVTTILTYLDNHYPDLEGDEARRGVWLVDVPLSQTHALRNKVNDGKPFSPEVLSEFDIPTVASLLKLYLLELPDSLVSSHVYEIIRTIYNNPGEDTSDAHRVAVLQQTLSQLRLTNIATLDACMNHFTRLIELTTADEEYVSALATSLAPCVLRPRVETSLTMEEKHAYRLLRDLFANKTAVFSELKRMSTLGHSTSVGTSNNRPRAISTDESNRRIHQEERQRALLEKAGGPRSRATSPVPSSRASGTSTGSHRRDRSVGRFPVQTSPTEKGERTRMSMGPILGIKRSSLEVPGEGGASSDSVTNGSESTDSPTSLRSRSETLRSTDSFEKRNSLGRNPARSSLGRRIPVNPTPVADPDEHRGVTLEDKPMDD
ncbi:Rho-GTPase-activating protein 8 [Cytospora mali]|uniref:Rho-GTPase-activating protein 8 n=1 Tax=Cytospora mali TaxID=578113 RepID=A0A194W3F7_CYTMA|nr:Rho-GTPase-activating protein 8 [Valsa mali]